MPLAVLAQRIDAICDRFEANWKAGRRLDPDMEMTGMAKVQCPNCGGFDNYSWMTDWLTSLASTIVMAGVFAAGAAYFKASMGVIFFLGIGGYYTLIVAFEYLGKPNGSRVCRLCKNDWTPKGDAHRARV